MNIRLQYGTQIRAAHGKQQEDYEVAGPLPLRELLARIATEQAVALSSVLTDTGTWHPGVLCFVNDQAYPVDSDVIVHDGDEVALMTVISGG